MLARENELRLSSEVQRRFEEAEKSGATDWIEVASELQKQVMMEFNVTPSERALRAYRCAANRHEISLYVKYNRARQGDLAVGSEAPNVPLVSIDGQEDHTGQAKVETTLLLANQKADRPLIVIAGSIS